MRRLRLTTALAVCFATSTICAAQVDTYSMLVPTAVVNGGGGALAWATTYDPGTDTAWAYVQNVNPALSGIRKYANVSSGSPVLTPMALNPQVVSWRLQGSATAASTFPFALAFNPQQVGTIPAGGAMWVVELSTTSSGAPPAVDSALTQRLYRYNLQPLSDTSTLAELNAALMPVASRAAFQLAAGQPVSGSLETNNGRQPAFSSDGARLYMLDNGAANRFPGIYRVDPLGINSVTRLSTPVTASTASEPAVVTVNGIDRVYYRSATPSLTNGLTVVEHNSVTNETSAEVAAPSASASQLAEFLQVGWTPVVTGATADAAGNVYFNVNNAANPNDPSGGRVLRLDPQGRLVKVSSRGERLSLYPAGTTTVMSRMQAYTHQHPTAGPITRISVNDATQNGITAISAFQPGDFNRDGLCSVSTRRMFGACSVARPLGGV